MAIESLIEYSLGVVLEFLIEKLMIELILCAASQFTEHGKATYNELDFTPRWAAHDEYRIEAIQLAATALRELAKC